MTADHPTREERYAAVLAAHWEVDVDNGGDQTEFYCDGCKETLVVGDGTGLDHSHRAHVAAALVAADPAPAQPDAALTDDERERLHKTMRHWRGTDEGLRREVIAVVNRILAARAAQPVPAPEVSRGVAEAWDEGFAAGAESAYRGDDPADRVNPYALPADDGADCCRERTTAGGCGCGS